MNREEKTQLIETLQSTLSEATTVVVTHQTGMTVAESTELRVKMREAGASYKVTKNRITRIALQDTKFENLTDLFTGSTAMGASADPVAAAKVLVDFAKSNDKLTIVGGSLDGKVLDKAGVTSLASMPSLDELRAKLVGLLNAPATKLARVSQAPASQLARVIKARADQLQ
ncbi:MAG: 50S ribosomal protein L10 [Candidatus Puniceispirillaceae bacterium]|jgi:large subunit ribosomal protein L10